MSSNNFKQELFTQFTRVGKAMSNGNRLELLEFIAQGGRSDDELAKISGLSVANACVGNLSQRCDKGNVAVGLFVGTTCYKRSECGKKGQRPCLVEERIPACNKGWLKIL